jgi:hypothetical protein
MKKCTYVWHQRRMPTALAALHQRPICNFSAADTQSSHRSPTSHSKNRLRPRSSQEIFFPPVASMEGGPSTVEILYCLHSVLGPVRMLRNAPVSSFTSFAATGRCSISFGLTRTCSLQSAFACRKGSE